MIIPVKTAGGGYDIILERGVIYRAGECIDLNRRVLIVTDKGVPKHYAEAIVQQCAEPYLVTVPQGEASKCFDMFQELLHRMVFFGFTRTDCVVAVGGGVVGDLAGFAASCYMRGIDFYNIPTTVLSQVDSSIGGKTAIDFDGYKNIVGAFWPPKAVLIDPDTLRTLPQRQVSNGLAEAVKMSLTSDPELFGIFESGNAVRQIDTVIERALRIKKSVVEQDEKESGLRKILNFGHTLAHAIESEKGMEQFYHGECVAIGMLMMCSDEVRARLLPVLEGLQLPTGAELETERIIAAMQHDKKMSGNEITVIYVPEVGRFEMRKLPFAALREQVIKAVGE